MLQKGSYAYVADGDSGLQVIDISNPSSPNRVGYYDTPGSAYDVAVKGSYAYVADGSGGLQIYKNLLIDVEEGGKLLATAEEYLSKGESAFKKEDYDSAILYYTKAIGCLKYAKAYLWRGIAYTRKSQFLKAMWDFENVIELEPEGDNAMRAKIYLAALEGAQELKEEVSKQPSEEGQKIIHSLEQLPVDELECPQVLETVAECYEKLGKVDKSAQYYHLAGDIYSHAEEHIKAAQFLSKAGQTYEKIEDYGSAAGEYGFAGNSYLKAAKNIEAATEYSKAGDMFKKVGNFERAAKMYYSAGDAYYDAGLKSKANEMYEKAAAMYYEQIEK